MPNPNNAKFITFASPKGGVGKSTSCLSIASALLTAGEKVRIIDLDQTRTIWRWYSESDFAKGLTNLTVEEADSSTIDIAKLYREATDYVLIDLAGFLHDDTIVWSVFSDLTITPAKVSEPDIIEANKLAKLIHAKLKTLRKPGQHRILLNELPPGISIEEADLIQQIDNSSLPHFKTKIYRRAVYNKTFSKGMLPHFITKPDQKALAELDSLMGEIRAILEPVEERVAA